MLPEGSGRARPSISGLLELPGPANIWQIGPVKVSSPCIIVVDGG